MCRLIGGFAGRTYHIVGNLMSRSLKLYSKLNKNSIKKEGQLCDEKLKEKKIKHGISWLKLHALHVAFSASAFAIRMEDRHSVKCL